MERTMEIEQRIDELRSELENVEGTRTEIYTRIVGYYRSLKNWNRGKREEYDHRVTFKSGEVRSCTASEPARTTVSAIPAAETLAEAEVETASISTDAGAQPTAIQSYQYYFRESCPRCPPVRTFVENLALDGEMVDVDTGEGMAKAVEHQILSTPTVILRNDRGDTIAQAGSVDQLRVFLESAG